ncbi:MAG: hypothetical protein DMF66_15990 [Acidobacteria bacterium]|nr:MAG: hypothetical protein DMF66_15990 [Acidobacteriota bacterium]
MPTYPKAAFLVIACLGLFARVALAQVPPSPATSPTASRHFEYLWYEAENMQGISVDARNEPRANPSWMELTRAQAPGFALNGPGVSAEWSQGGESEWDSVAAAADETHAVIYQDIEVPRDGEYRVWARYADWANRTENFVVRITQQGSEVSRREFGARDRVDPHDVGRLARGLFEEGRGAPLG